MIDLITGDELAARLRYKGQTGAYRAFLKETGICPVPGRKDCFDPVAVRQKLNDAQGLGASSVPGKSLLEISKERRHAA